MATLCTLTGVLRDRRSGETGTSCPLLLLRLRLTRRALTRCSGSALPDAV